jgi:hypothetical protein
MSREINNDDFERANGANLLKWLWDISGKKPCLEPPPTVNTDIYSLPPTNRRIPQRPLPMKK